MEAEAKQTYHLDTYREYILFLLKLFSQIWDTNIRFKLEENLPDFHASRIIFTRYMKNLREETGYTRPFGRNTSSREDFSPGYEAQVDFGQYRLKGAC